MERMSIGSPSNAADISLSTTANTSSFLPSYLLGSNETAEKPITPHKSPYRNNNFEDILSTPKRDRSSLGRKTGLSTEKHDCGLPKESLLDYDATHVISDVRNTPNSSMIYTNSTPNVRRSFSNSIRENDTMDHWVTIFGFPASQTQSVLSHFGQYGVITDTKPPSKNAANYIHVRYNTKIQAENAISKNGKLISSNLMIGVVKCTDMVVLGDHLTYKSNLAEETRQLYPGSPLSPMHPSPRQFMRPLRTTTQLNQELVQANGPTKSTGLASKTVQLLFGW